MRHLASAQIGILVPVLIVASACKKEEPPPAPPPAKVETEAREIDLKPDANPVVVTPKKVDERGIPDADFIYQTTRRFFAEQKRSPKNLEELIAKGYMPPLPAPPPGKRYVLNERAAMIVLEDVKK